MMKHKIYKYKLSAAAGQETIDLPKGATILCAKAQHNDLYIYCSFDIRNEDIPTYRYIEKVHTGALYDSANAKFIDTVMLGGDNYVLHLFEITENEHPS